MATQIENLWAEVIEKEDFTLPKTILTQQANYLKKISHNLLQGEIMTTSYDEFSLLRAPELVDSMTNIHRNDRVATLHHDFYITLPKNNYRYRLLGVSHEIDLYPLIVHGYLEEKRIRANNEEEFKNILSQLFRSPKTQRILNILTSQAKA